MTDIDGPPPIDLQNYHFCRESRFNLNARTDGSGADDGFVESYSDLESHLSLRCYLNRIVALLYTTELAYCHPYTLVDTIAKIDGQLESWYRALPVKGRFARSTTTFTLSSHTMSSQLVSTHHCTKQVTDNSTPRLPSLFATTLAYFYSTDLFYTTSSIETSRMAQRRQNRWRTDRTLSPGYLRVAVAVCRAQF